MKNLPAYENRRSGVVKKVVGPLISIEGGCDLKVKSILLIKCCQLQANILNFKLHATKLYLRDKQLNRVFPSDISNLKEKKCKPAKMLGRSRFHSVSFNQGAQAAHARWIYKFPHVFILFCILRDYESLYRGL